ncbi:T9SS type A sorting domain-containing protein [Pontibacter sp. FD36]|uniref:T9SS type A sorting domain-containing protein n=1 Tax=Pontibacter sp. FD36 TaxID=2789860 RepID=UPI0018AADE06|nr:T9SS type A sorting domain-containing protein [Pontibacter sp. FD36]MBF8964109.1 T9SS type A sorting domain-containing protein [Pontibacter sp. FD36]
MRLIYTFLMLLLLLSCPVVAQQVEWVKVFPKNGYDSQVTVKTDLDGNIYLVNTHPSNRNSGSITKMNSDGVILWDINFSYPAGQSDQVINFTLDPAGNLYGTLIFAGTNGFDLKAMNGTFPIGKSPEGTPSNSYATNVLTFKISKDGEYNWSTVYNTYNYHIHTAELRFDPHTNTLYHVGAYALFLNSDKTTLNTLATRDRDLVPTVFFCALNAETGEEQVLKNLYMGGAGTLVPLSDRLSYFQSATTTPYWQHLNHQGEPLQHKSFATDMHGYTHLSEPFLIQAGHSSYRDPVRGSYDTHNKIRITDLYGDVVREKEFFYWNELYQQKYRVFGNFDVQRIHENALLALISGPPANFDTDKAPFDGEMLTARNFRFLLLDRELNITKKLPASSSNSLSNSSLLYSQKDKALYLFLESRVKNSFTVGGTIIDIPPNRNYVLVKLTLDELMAAQDHANVLSFLVDGQISSAGINHENKVVTAFVGPGSNLTHLNPKLYVSEGARLKAPLSLSANFNHPQKVTVVSHSGKEQQWTLQVKKTLGTGNAIELVEFPGQLHVLIDSLHKRVDVLVANDVDPDNLRLSDFKASAYATVSPDPYQMSDFSQTRQLLITAENGEKSNWSLHVSRKLRGENSILDISLKDQLGPSRINDIDRVIAVSLARSADWYQTIEHLVLSPGANVLSPPGHVHDFSTETKLTVEAEDGKQAVWTVKAEKVNASSLREAVQVYPVPTDDALTIDFLFLEKSPAILELIATDGRMLFRTSIPPGNSSRHTFDISSVKPGLYMLRLTHANQMHAQKIIIQR